MSCAHTALQSQFDVRSHEPYTSSFVPSYQKVEIRRDTDYLRLYEGRQHPIADCRGLVGPSALRQHAIVYKAISQRAECQHADAHKNLNLNPGKELVRGRA